MSERRKNEPSGRASAPRPPNIFFGTPPRGPTRTSCVGLRQIRQFSSGIAASRPRSLHFINDLRGHARHLRLFALW